MDDGIRPGLRIRIVLALASEIFTQMGALRAVQLIRTANSGFGD